MLRCVAPKSPNSPNQEKRDEICIFVFSDFLLNQEISCNFVHLKSTQPHTVIHSLKYREERNKNSKSKVFDSQCVTPAKRAHRVREPNWRRQNSENKIKTQFRLPNNASGVVDVWPCMVHSLAVLVTCVCLCTMCKTSSKWLSHEWHTRIPRKWSSEYPRNIQKCQIEYRVASRISMGICMGIEFRLKRILFVE